MRCLAPVNQRLGNTTIPCAPSLASRPIAGSSSSGVLASAKRASSKKRLVARWERSCASAFTTAFGSPRNPARRAFGITSRNNSTNFSLSVKAKDPAALRPKLESLLGQSRLQFELRSSTEENLTYEVRMPLDRKVDGLSNGILKLAPENVTGVEWEEKKEKK